jgi:uncharacterized membrane protein
MSHLAQIVYLAATDPEFRRALQADPKAATAAQGLTLNDEELSALRALRHLLGLAPEELARVIRTRLDADMPPWYW